MKIASQGSLANNDIIRAQINGLTNGFRMFQDAGSNVRYTFENGNVGIGTASPTAKLHVASGDVAITTQSNGVILRATEARTASVSP